MHLPLPENENQARESILDMLNSHSNVPVMDPHIAEAIKSAILQSDKISFARPPHRIHFLKRPWLRYAAAIILAIGVAAAIIVSSERQSGQQILVSSNKRLQTDIAPGRDRAILTLANGRQIMLDSIQGNIIQQGSLTVVNLAGQLKYEGRSTNAEYNTISTPRGGQYQIVLPDGSKVWLNAASSIKFPTAFTGHARHVEMTGEAYMEIARNPKQSFTITANGAKIQVLGTSFNINAYADESVVKTTLIEGSVKVISGDLRKFNSPSNSKAMSAVVVSSDQQPNSSGTDDNHVQSVILKPGQQAVVSSDQQLKMVANADIEQTLAWKNGVFNFNDLDVRAAMKQLARWYDINIRYEGPVPTNIFKGKMYRDVKLSVMLDRLRDMGIKCRMEGKTVVVMQ